MSYPVRLVRLHGALYERLTIVGRPWHLHQGVRHVCHWTNSGYCYGISQLRSDRPFAGIDY